ncbi:MAG: glycine zipper domain-containing protein [Chromatiaceae bacterium]|jgi:hypothetical protein
MIKQVSALLILATALAAPAVADDLNTRAAVGGGLGGALGAFIGSEVGGRSGAILGGGLGGALGSVVGTDTYRDRRYYDDRYYYPARGPGRHRHGKYRGYDWDD